MGLLTKFQANPSAAITEITYGSMRSGFRGGGEGAVQLGELSPDQYHATWKKKKRAAEAEERRRRPLTQR